VSVPAAEMLKKSILVVAHPDDEVLWFSSIVEQVDQVLVCFLSSRTHPQWMDGRKKSLAAHPVKGISSLGLEQAGVFDGADWGNPQPCEYGMRMIREGEAQKKYLENHRCLLKQLSTRLQGYQNVITHNPWGEYGHEEHVQIYQTIKSLAASLSFDLWFSNYCSNRSYPLMLNYLRGFNSDYLSLPTNERLGEKAKTVYQENHCWTWYDDYIWFQQECFMKDWDVPEDSTTSPVYGHRFPLNFVRIDIGNEGRKSKKKRRKTSFWRRFLKKWE